MGREDLELPVELRTDRLLLRSARPGDGPALHAAIETSLPDLFPWLSFSARMPDAETLDRVSREAHEKFAAREFFVWRVWEPDGETMIGTVDLHSIDWAVPSCEIGFWMRSSHTGCGLAKKAVRAVIQVARERLGVFRIEARCDTRNERAWRLVERLGFDFEGIARHDDRDASGTLCSTRVYALTRDEDRQRADERAHLRRGASDIGPARSRSVGGVTDPCAPESDRSSTRPLLAERPARTPVERVAGRCDP